MSLVSLTHFPVPVLQQTLRDFDLLCNLGASTLYTTLLAWKGSWRCCDYLKYKQIII